MEITGIKKKEVLEEVRARNLRDIYNDIFDHWHRGYIIDPFVKAVYPAEGVSALESFNKSLTKAMFCLRGLGVDPNDDKTSDKYIRRIQKSSKFEDFSKEIRKRMYRVYKREYRIKMKEQKKLGLTLQEQLPEELDIQREFNRLWEENVRDSLLVFWTVVKS